MLLFPLLVRAFNKVTAFPIGKVFPYFQPIFQLQEDGELALTGFETLARKKQGASILTPYHFLKDIPSHRYPEFDLHMLNSACDFIQQCEAQNLPVPPINVNFYPETLSVPGMADKIQKCLEKYDVSSQQIVVEVLENSFERDEAYILNTLVDLNRAGHFIAVDDLCMGDASIERVEELRNVLPNKNVPLIVKVDKAFGDLLYKHSKSFLAILKNKNLMGVDVVFEGGNEDSMQIISRELQDVNNPNIIKFQNFACGKPGPIKETMEVIRLEKTKPIPQEPINSQDMVLQGHKPLSFS